LPYKIHSLSQTTVPVTLSPVEDKAKGIVESVFQESPLKEDQHLGSFLHHLDSALSSSTWSEDEDYSLLLWSRMFVTPGGLAQRMIDRADEGLVDHACLRRVFSRWAVWFPEDFAADEAAALKARRICRR